MALFAFPKIITMFFFQRALAELSKIDPVFKAYKTYTANPSGGGYLYVLIGITEFRYPGPTIGSASRKIESRSVHSVLVIKYGGSIQLLVWYMHVTADQCSAITTLNTEINLLIM